MYDCEFIQTIVYTNIKRSIHASSTRGRAPPRAPQFLKCKNAAGVKYSLLFDNPDTSVVSKPLHCYRYSLFACTVVNNIRSRRN